MLLIGNFIICILKINIVCTLIGVPSIRHTFSNTSKNHSGIWVLFNQERKLRIRRLYLNNRHTELSLLPFFYYRVIIGYSCIDEHGKSITTQQLLLN
ncbi:hypothetical protein D3C78_830150 [compost metagenome]